MATILEQWHEVAYNAETDQIKLRDFWQAYFLKEKSVYEQLLADPKTEVKGTVKELAEKYNLELLTMVGFLDGINESLETPNPIETMDENTVVSLKFVPETLYKNMVDAKADWLYDIPAWDDILEAEQKKALFKEARQMHTVKNVVKIGRNDPCPCGSGKKYKQCCMKKDQGK